MYKLLCLLKKIVCSFVICILFTGNNTLAIQDLDSIPGGSKITLEDCIEYAYAHSPIIKKAKNKVLSAQSKIGQTKSIYFPQLSANTGYYISQNERKWDNDHNYHGLNVNLSQKIWDFGKMNTDLNYYKFHKKAAELDLEYAYVQTAYDVKMSYYKCLNYWAKFLINQRNTAIQQLQYERAEALFKEGLKSKIDVVDADLALNKAKHALKEAASDYYTEVMILKNKMFWSNCPEQYVLAPTETFKILTDYKYEVDLTKSLNESDIETVLTQGIKKTNVLGNKKEDFLSLPHNIDWYLEQSRTSNPYLLGIQLIEEAAKETLKGVKRMYNPDLDLRLGYNLNNTHISTTQGFSISGVFGFNNINAMNYKYKIKEAEALLAMAKDDTETYKINNEWDVRDKVAWMLKFPAIINIKLNQIECSLQYLKLADARYTIGTGNFIELQQAANEYYTAQLEYVDIISEYNQVLAMLNKSIGIR